MLRKIQQKISDRTPVSFTQTLRFSIWLNGTTETELTENTIDAFLTITKARATMKHIR